MYKNVADLLKNWGPFGDLFCLLSKVDGKKRNIFPFLRVLQNTEFLRATESTTSYAMCNGLSANWSNYICNKKAVTTVLRVIVFTQLSKYVDLVYGVRAKVF